MNGNWRNWIGRSCPRSLITPSGFLRIAILVAVVYPGCHWLGWWEYASFLSGTGANGEDGKLPLVLGAVYVVAYLGFVLATPIPVVAAGIFAVLLTCHGKPPDLTHVTGMSDHCPRLSLEPALQQAGPRSSSSGPIQLAGCSWGKVQFLQWARRTRDAATAPIHNVRIGIHPIARRGKWIFRCSIPGHSGCSRLAADRANALGTISPCPPANSCARSSLISLC